MVTVPDICIEDEEEALAAEPIKICPHLKKCCRFRKIEPKIRELKNRGSRVCKTCNKESSRSDPLPEAAQLWLCLNCGNLFCGRYDHGHAAAHHTKVGDTDCMMWNIESYSCWCYLCDDAIRTSTHKNEALIQVEKYWQKHAEGAAAIAEEIQPAQVAPLNYTSLTPGLQNLGNTCFFNSVVQVLACVEELHEIISPHPYRERSMLEMKSTSGLTLSFTKLLAEIYASDRQKLVLKPQALFGEVHRKFSRFTRGAQQDAQELLHFLFEGLKADEVLDRTDGRPDLKRTRSRRKTTGEEEFEMSDRTSKKEKKNEWKPANYIESIFEGRLASIVVCSACKSISTTYDQFEELSLSIVQEKANAKERKSRFRTAIDDLGRKGRTSLSLTRSSSMRRGGSAMSRSGSKEGGCESDTPSGQLSPRITRGMLAAATKATPVSMSEAVSEEETEEGSPDKQLKSHTFSMSDAKLRLERLSFAFSRKPSGALLSPNDLTTSGQPSGSNLNSNGIPAASLERLQYIERLLYEPENTDVRGSIEDSLRDFTTVECLEGDNAFACEECAKLMYAPPSPVEVRGKYFRGVPDDARGDLITASTSSRSEDKKSSISSMSAMDIDVDIPNGSTDMTVETQIDADVMQTDEGTDQTSSVRTPKTIEKPKHILRKAYKRFLVADLPNILILHLKRFQQSGKSIYSSLRKNDALVSFDAELDMTPYLMPRPDASNDSVITGTRYRCIGAVVHIGTINSGHYVAYFLTHKVTDTKNPLNGEAGSKQRQWVFASDAMTRPCSWQEVAKSRAYLVWYERIR